jgi:hypothetical protein
MAQKWHRYHGSVFSHRRNNWIGMDQGKGLLYRGDQVEMTLNVDVRDNVFTVREGQELKELSTNGIESGEKTLSGITIASGTNLFFDEDFPSLTV